MAEHAKDHMPEIQYAHEANGTSGEPQLLLQDDAFIAGSLLFKAEFGDKTCLILIILTICWSNWYRDVPFPYFQKKVRNP